MMPPVKKCRAIQEAVRASNVSFCIRELETAVILAAG